MGLEVDHSFGDMLICAPRTESGVRQVQQERAHICKIRKGEPDQGPPRARPRLSCLLLPHEAQSILETAQAWGVAERQLRSSGAPGSWG